MTPTIVPVAFEELGGAGDSGGMGGGTQGSGSSDPVDPATAPTIQLGGTNVTSPGLPLQEGDEFGLTITSAITPKKWKINWRRDGIDGGDGITEIVLGSNLNPTHTFVDGGSYTVTVSAEDAYGEYKGEFNVAVAHKNPEVAIEGHEGNEAIVGSAYTLKLNATTSPADTITSWSINWGDGTQSVTGNPWAVTDDEAHKELTKKFQSYRQWDWPSGT